MSQGNAKGRRERAQKRERERNRTQVHNLSISWHSTTLRFKLPDVLPGRPEIIEMTNINFISWPSDPDLHFHPKPFQGLIDNPDLLN